MTTLHKMPALAATILLAGAGLATLFTQPACAAAPFARTQPAGFQRVMVGDFEVTALLDENSPWPEGVEALFPQLKAEQIAAVRRQTHQQSQNDFSTNAFLINTGKQLILIDAGGRGSGPGYGQLFANLLAAGYRPEQVDDIYITHMHPDHVFGLSEQARRSFPNAVVHADERELPQWEALAAQGNARAIEIVNKIQPYRDAGRYRAFHGDTVFSTGFSALAAYGHTEGHSFYVIDSRGQTMQFWGDFVVNDKLQFEMPELAPPGEAEAAQGIALRQRRFAEAAGRGYLVAGAHFAFPGIGRVRALDRKYVWVPIDYAAIAGAQ